MNVNILKAGDQIGDLTGGERGGGGAGKTACHRAGACARSQCEVDASVGSRRGWAMNMPHRATAEQVLIGDNVFEREISVSVKSAAAEGRLGIGRDYLKTVEIGMEELVRLGGGHGQQREDRSKE